MLGNINSFLWQYRNMMLFILHVWYVVGVTMPEEYGGMGLDILYAAVNWEEQSYAGATGPGWALHSEICMPYLLHYGSG